MPSESATFSSSRRIASACLTSARLWLETPITGASSLPSKNAASSPIQRGESTVLCTQYTSKWSSPMVWSCISYMSATAVFDDAFMHCGVSLSET